MSDLKFVLEHTMLDEDDVIALVLPTGERVWKGMVKDAYPLSESYSFNRFVKQEQINEKFNKPTEVLEVSEIKKETKKPVKGTYSLENKDDVLKAIKFFNYQKADKEEDYANAIINKMHEYGISSDKIGEDNRLCKYIDSCTADLSEEVLNEKKFEDVSKMSDEDKRAEIDRLKKIMDTADDDKYPSLVYASTEKRIQKLEGSLQEHLSGNMTAEDIAKKHDVDADTINKQVEMGIKVEHEHTKDDDEAKRIALDHLYEIPDYYTRLKKMEEEGEAALEEAICNALLDDEDEPLFEDLNHGEKRRWRIIKNTMKFVDFESVKNAFPSLDGKSNKEIIRQLKYMLEQLPEEKKKELIQSHQAKELEAKTLGIGKGHHIAGNIVAGAGGPMVAASGALSTEAALYTAAGAVSDIGGAIGFTLLAPLILVGGLALSAIATVATIGIAKGVSNAKMHNAQRKHATMMSQDSIINELKKYAKPKEDEPKVVAQAKSLKLALAEAKIPGEHKCPNCGATLDAWDGTFCDKKCKEEYENRNKPQSKEQTNEELLTEKPLYTVDDNDKDFGRREIKKIDGSSFKSKEEVEKIKNSGGITKSNSGIGCFSPDGSYVDGNNKSRDVAYFNHKQTGKFSSEKPEKVYKAKKYKGMNEAFVDDDGAYTSADRIEILRLLENEIDLGEIDNDTESDVLTEGKVKTFFIKTFVGLLPEKALDRILGSMKTRIQSTSGPKKDQALEEISKATDKKSKRVLIRKWLNLVPESKMQQTEAHIESKVKQKPTEQLTEAVVEVGVAGTTALIAVGISAAVGLILGALLVAIPVIVGNKA